MLIYTEKRLRDFDFWAGGADNARYFTYEQLDEIEVMLKDILPNGVDETKLNDLFWFEADWLAKLLGFANFEALMGYSLPWE